MEAYLIEWLNLFGRWLHMIAGIAWIGASFYFVWLDNHLLNPKDAEDVKRGVGGEVWSVHGGGFYHAQKYTVAPPELPQSLHWFKWEAYTTWLSGIFLMALIYWYGAQVYLIDPSVMDLSVPVAVALGIGSLIVGWVVYDQLCKSPLGKDDKKLGAVIFVFVVIAAWVLCQLFSGRGAYIHFGAMLGTIMVANVFFVIIPGQGELVQAKKEGREPDPTPGLNAKQRSVHNTYFTLPVLFVMISNHYAMTYGSTYNWLILIAISLAGALIRVFFVQRHFGRTAIAPLASAIVLLLAVIVAMSPSPVETTPTTASASTQQDSSELFTEVEGIIDERCASCHASNPTQPGFTAPPKGVVFNNPHDILTQAKQIHEQTVVSKVMPIGNITQITDEERETLDQWFKAGALGGDS